MSDVVLWDYPKSSASYRVRIALNLAGIDYKIEVVDLLGGKHKSPEHVARNPQGFVPVLDIDGHRFTQSLAIIEYLDQTRTMHLLPSDPVQKARAQALAHTIAIDLHPVCNLSVAAHATGGQEPARSQWMRHFIRPGLLAFEAQLGYFGDPEFSVSKSPGLADLCLIPQLYNAKRWGADYSDCPRIIQIENACANMQAFQAAHPDA